MGRKPGAKKAHPVEYAAFHAAKARCAGAKHKTDYRYVGRIEFRFSNFQEFFDELGPRPDGHELDRKDNEGHYEPGNVRWATRKTNIRNRSNTILLTHDGVTKPLGEWAEEAGVDYYTAYWRQRRGLTSDEILSTKHLPKMDS